MFFDWLLEKLLSVQKPSFSSAAVQYTNICKVTVVAWAERLESHVYCYPSECGSVVKCIVRKAEREIGYVLTIGELGGRNQQCYQSC
jgi:hypothetical protein